jgi:hypothetical protein
MREKPLANEANEQRWAATWETALADEANKQHCHVTAMQEDVLANVAGEQHCQESAEHTAASAKSALVLEQAPVSADLALPKPARTADKRFMVPVLPPDPVGAAIRRIWADCTLCAAPLDAILAKIASNDIAHEAQALPTTTLPHPAAMLSSPPHPMTYVGAVLSTLGGSPHATSPALAPLALPLPTVDGQHRTVRRRAQPCRCTGYRHRPCVPNPPDEVLPSHPHPMLGRLPTPTKTLTMLARATSPCCSVVSSPLTSLTTSSTSSLLPFTFSSKVLLSLGGGTALPFCVGGQNPPPWKCSQRKHQPCCSGQHHGPRAPNLQEHLLRGRQHRPRAPNQSTSTGWA